MHGRDRDGRFARRMIHPAGRGLAASRASPDIALSRPARALVSVENLQDSGFSQPRPACADHFGATLLHASFERNHVTVLPKIDGDRLAGKHRS